MFASMVLKDLHRKYLNELGEIYPKGESENITRIIFEEMAGISRSDIIKDPTSILPDIKLLLLAECLERLMNHEPVQYITGFTWFYKMKFNVSPAVLIPRPETEELVQEAISFLKEKNNPTVLDIGTGSGCIPIAIKKNIPQAIVSSIDVSADALKIANENATANQVSVDFKQIDFLHEENWKTLTQFDAIISNPPYIPEEEQKIIDKNVVDFEPSIALFVEDNNPLIFYKKIAMFAKLHLKKEGKIFMESHENLAHEVCDLFQKEGYDALIKKDICEKDRIVIVSQCP